MVAKKSSLRMRAQDIGCRSAPTPPSDTDLARVSEVVDAFNEVRHELVSTLYFLLGSHEEAQRAAREAFVKCCRTRPFLPPIRDLQAWIFHVAVNTARAVPRETTQ